MKVGIRIKAKHTGEDKHGNLLFDLMASVPDSKFNNVSHSDTYQINTGKKTKPEALKVINDIIEGLKGKIKEQYPDVINLDIKAGDTVPDDVRCDRT